MIFWITIKHDRKNYKLKVEQIVVDSRIEHFKIMGANKTITLESNRPIFRNKGIRHRKPDFKLIEGKVSHGDWVDILGKAIMDHLEP